MYLPVESASPDVVPKKILLWNGMNSWGGVPMGREVFLKEKCPVNNCDIGSDRDDAGKSWNLELIARNKSFLWHLSDKNDPPRYGNARENVQEQKYSEKCFESGKSFSTELFPPPIKTTANM